MGLKFVLTSCVLFLLINCWLVIIVPARSHHHHHSHHGDYHSKSHRSRNIWGSLPASPERWKFMALLKIPNRKGGVDSCSSILINNRSLLTAAHCVENYSVIKPILVLLKGKSFETFDRTKDHGILHQTRSCQIYEKYWDYVDDISKSEPYDIAIVKLRNPIVLDPKQGIDKVDLPIGPDGKQYPFDPNTCYLVAYGKEMPVVSPYFRLQQVKVPILPRDVCKKHVTDIERQICYGYQRKPSQNIPKASASGDSGGAFLCKTIHFHSGKHTRLPKYCLIAMNTCHFRGNNIQERLSTGVRITKYMDWIRQNS